MEELRTYGPIEGFHRYSYQPVKIVLDKYIIDKIFDLKNC